MSDPHDQNLEALVDQIDSLKGADLDPGAVEVPNFEAALQAAQQSLSRAKEAKLLGLIDLTDEQAKLVAIRRAERAERAEREASEEAERLAEEAAFEARLQEAQPTVLEEQTRLRRYGPELYQLVRSGQATRNEAEQLVRRRERDTA